MFTVSLGLHLAVFLIIARSQILPAFQPDEPQVTYVDMVTLPVASPQSGIPVQAEPEPPSADAAPAPAPPQEMALPQPKPQDKQKQAKTQEEPAPKEKVAAKPAPQKPEPQKPAADDEAREHEERIAKLRRLADEKRQEAVIAGLKRKGNTRVGMPGAKGSEAGSDYSSYLQSRLKDAFERTMASQSKSPQVIATISVGPDARIKLQVDKKSGDPLFDDAVARAVALAGKSLPPPPGGVEFRRVFRFRPEEVQAR